MNNRLNILADTNSLAHLSNVQFNIGKFSDIWLWEYYDVFRLKVINEEFERNLKRKKSRSFKRRTHRIYKKEATFYHVKQVDLIEETIIAKYYNKPLGKDDRGERHLIAHAIAGVKTGKFNYCIVLTDDHKAFTNFLSNIKQDFSFGEVWNVLDLIIHLYLSRNNISFDDASNAIRTLVSLSSISAKKYKSDGMTESDARIKMFDDYLEKIKEIAKLKTII